MPLVVDAVEQRHQGLDLFLGEAALEPALVRPDRLLRPDQQGIALNRIEVISYGETKPVVDNKTREHRAQNRRVVINVLE